jgi:hypothetical protein
MQQCLVQAVSSALPKTCRADRNLNAQDKPGQVEDAVLEAVVPHVHFYVLAPGMVLFAQGEQVRLCLSGMSWPRPGRGGGHHSGQSMTYGSCRSG